MSPGKWKPKSWPTPKKRGHGLSDSMEDRLIRAFRDAVIFGRVFYETPFSTVARAEDAERVSGMRLIP